MSDPSRPTKRLGRPRRTPDYDPAATRDRVLDAAEALLERRGYAAMSMEQIAKALGATKGALYHHFPEGKDALILAVAHRMLDRDVAGLRGAIDSSQTARARLEAVGAWMLSERRDTERVLRDTQRFLPEEDNRQIAERFVREFVAQIEGVLREAVSREELPPHDTSFVSWAFLSLITEFAGLQGVLDEPTTARQIVDFVVGGLHSVRLNQGASDLLSP